MRREIPTKMTQSKARNDAEANKRPLRYKRQRRATLPSIDSIAAKGRAGVKGRGILKLRSIEMAIKLVARPRHGQYEHNKSSHTHTQTRRQCRQPYKESVKEWRPKDGPTSIWWNSHHHTAPAHHNPIQPQRDINKAHRAKIITMVKGIRQRGT